MCHHASINTPTTQVGTLRGETVYKVTAVRLLASLTAEESDDQTYANVWVLYKLLLFLCHESCPRGDGMCVLLICPRGCICIALHIT